MRYGERVLAARGGMARAAEVQFNMKITLANFRPAGSTYSQSAGCARRRGLRNNTGHSTVSFFTKIHCRSNRASHAAWVFSMTERNSSRLIFRRAMITAGSIRAVSAR
jgi:hypothetical protein